MYLQFHQLETLPFENTPDPRFFFLSEDHREALANLAYAVRYQKGMVLITGDVGMGKTTTSYFLETRIGEAAHVVVIRQVPTTPKQLLWHIADELGLSPSPSLTRGELVRMVRHELARQHEHNRTVLLLIDEAQALPMNVLDEIRLLSNLETATYKLCQILLIGQSELRTILQAPRLVALRQRIALAHHLRPLSRENTGRYIRHRIARAAKVSPPAVQFTEAAIDRVHEMTHGIIRQINVVADKSLLVASVHQTHTVDVREVNEAELPAVGPESEIAGAVGMNPPLGKAA